MKIFLLLSIFCAIGFGVDVPQDPLEGLPFQSLYQPQPPPKIPVKVGERRCDNSYNGGVLPCLLRPWLPAYSYSTTEAYNGEYKRKKRSGLYVLRGSRK